AAARSAGRTVRRQALVVFRHRVVAFGVGVGHVRPLPLRLVVAVTVGSVGLVLVGGGAPLAGGVLLGRGCRSGHRGPPVAARARRAGARAGTSVVARGVGGVRRLGVGGRHRVRLAARVLLLARDHAALLAHFHLFVGDIAVGVDVVLGEVLGGLAAAGGELGHRQAAVAVGVLLVHLVGGRGGVRILRQGSAAGEGAGKDQGEQGGRIHQVTSSGVARGAVCAICALRA